MKVYVQHDSGSKGMRVEIVKEDDYRLILKNLANGMEYGISKIDFSRHYLTEDGGEAYKFKLPSGNDGDDSEKSEGKDSNKKKWWRGKK